MIINFIKEGNRDLVIFCSMFIQADGTLADSTKQQVIDEYLDKLLSRQKAPTDESKFIELNAGGVKKIFTMSARDL